MEGKAVVVRGGLLFSTHTGTTVSPRYLWLRCRPYVLWLFRFRVSHSHQAVKEAWPGIMWPGGKNLQSCPDSILTTAAGLCGWGGVAIYLYHVAQRFEQMCTPVSLCIPGSISPRCLTVTGIGVPHRAVAEPDPRLCQEACWSRPF